MLQLKTTTGAKLALNPDDIIAVQEDPDGCLIYTDKTTFHVRNKFMDVYEEWVTQLYPEPTLDEIEDTIEGEQPIGHAPLKESEPN